MNETVAAAQKEAAIRSVVKLEGEVAKFAHEALVEISKEWQAVQNDAQRLIRAGEIRIGIKQKEVVKAIAEKAPGVVVGEGITHGFNLRYMDTHGEVYVHQTQAPTGMLPQTPAVDVAPAQPTADAETPATVAGATA